MNMKATAPRALAVSLLLVVSGVLAISQPAGAHPPFDLAHRAQTSPATVVGSQITYQGQLLDGGAPANGVYDFRFTLWDAAAAGTQMGEPIFKDDVTVSTGLVTVVLDVLHGYFDGRALWLQIEVKADAVGPYTTLEERQPLTPVPYALSLVPGAIVDDTAPGGYGFEVRSGGNIAILAKSGSVPLLMPVGRVALYGLGEDTGVIGRGFGGAGTFGGQFSGNGGVKGTGGGDAGVTGVSQDSHGIYGQTDSDQPTRAGVHGYSRTGGLGVQGIADGAGAIGVKGSGSIGVKGTGSTGVIGEGDIGVRGTSSIGPGVQGEHTGAAPGTGVRGTTAVYSGIGVEGRADFGTGVSGQGETGVKGTSSVGPGVSGTGATGVSGSSNVGRGVFGESAWSRGAGVYGDATANSGTNYGVYGRTSSAEGYAGYFSGRVQVTGRFDSPDKHFKIDHPLDPAGQYLVHSSVESPDRLNIYNGNVTTDANGDATVVLPGYFEALNRDFRYQLTVIGQFAQAIVVREVRDDRFAIKTDKPYVKVSWQVTGVRHDRYADAHPIAVEEIKPPAEQGTYLNPVEHGQPETMGLDYQRARDSAERSQAESEAPGPAAAH